MEDLNVRNYSATIPYELGVLLKDAGYWDPRCAYESSYNGPCYFKPTKKFYPEGAIADWNEFVPAPTYADVIDWLFNKELVIIIDLVSESKLTWTWNILCIGDKLKNSRDSGYTGLIRTETIFGSFFECANNAIETALSYLYK